MKTSFFEKYMTIFIKISIKSPQVAPTIVRIANTRQWIRCRVVAKSAGSEDPVFTSINALLYEAKHGDGRFLNGKKGARSFVYYCFLGSHLNHHLVTLPL
jgi:hypothetical protein